MPRALALAGASIAVLVLTACDSGGSGTLTAPSAVSGTRTVTAAIEPALVPIMPVIGVGCPITQPFRSAFNIVLQSTTARVSVDRVTFHFLTGANVMSAPLTFGRESADALRTLSFTTQFGCDIGRPQLLVADLELLDAFGSPFTISTRARMQ